MWTDWEVNECGLNVSESIKPNRKIKNIASMIILIFLSVNSIQSIISPFIVADSPMLIHVGTHNFYLPHASLFTVVIM